MAQKTQPNWHSIGLKQQIAYIDLYNKYYVYRFAGYSSKESRHQIEPSPGLISRRPQEIPKIPRHNTNCL